MGPSSIADLLQRYGATGVSALCIVAMVVVFRLFKSSTDARIADLKAQLEKAGAALKAAQESEDAAQQRAEAALRNAQERETAALRAVLPVTEKLLLAISVLEAKNRRRAADVRAEPTPTPSLPVPK